MKVTRRPRLTLCILAGGASRRFGYSKSRMTWRGQPILTHLLQSLAPLQPALRVVSLGGDASITPPPGVGALDRVILDPLPYAGPLHGIAHVLSELRREACAGNDATFVVFAAVDMPCVSAVYIRRLVDTLHRQPGCALAMGSWRTGPDAGRAEPLPSVWRLGAGEKLARRAAEANARSLQRLALRTETVSMALGYPSQADEFLNVNRPGDVRWILTL